MAIHLVIRGRVQGVGYRDSMCRQAQRLQLGGWVRNRLDGTVEAIIDGDVEALHAMLDWAKQGPSAARVDSVDTEEVAGSFQSFERRSTA